MILPLVILVASTNPCENAKTQNDLNRCIELDFQKAETELNRQWALTTARAKDIDRAADRKSGSTVYIALVKSQKAWLHYREEHCQSEGTAVQSSPTEFEAIFDCKTRITNARILELRWD